MHAQTHTHHRMTLGRAMRLGIAWYFLHMPPAIIRRYAEYASALVESFSFVFLLRTLFSPWKNIQDPYPTKGFNLQRFAETLTLNVTARAIGFVIRIFTMLFGAVIQLALLASFLAFLAFWLAFPFLFVLSLVMFPLLLVRG